MELDRMTISDRATSSSGATRTSFCSSSRAGRRSRRSRRRITDSARHITLENLEADEDGMFESLLVQAPEDHSALEISYETGDAVIEQSAALAKQLKGEATAEQLKKLLRADARLDVMHFERVNADEAFGDDDDDIWRRSRSIRPVC